MGIIGSSIRATEDFAAATTSAAGAAAGAVAGAVAGGAVGAVGGGLQGIKGGLGLGSRSVPAAALTLAAVGATGLIDWPVLLAVGGTALVLRQLRNGHSTGDQAPGRAGTPGRNRASRPDAVPAAGGRSTARKAVAAAGATKTPAKTTARKAAPRKAAPRKRSAAASRS